MNAVPKAADREAPNTELALVFPILPGMAGEVERLADELSGPRASEYQRSQQALGIRKESWFLNRSPHGDSVTVYIESGSVLASLAKMISSQSTFDTWLKGEVHRLTGISFEKSSQLSLPKQIIRFST